MKKALIVVDVEAAFITDANKSIIGNILKLLKTETYDAYVEATFHAEKGSPWDVQQDYTCPEGPDTETCAEVAEALARFNPIRVKKETRSVFKGNPKLEPLLREQGIKEVHIVGLETDDCVLTTAHEAFDLEFIPVVIEECCESTKPGFHESGLILLRRQCMTNRSRK